MKGLVSDRFYRFRVCAIDVNGLGQWSEITSIQACAPPTGIEMPEVSSVTATSFKVRWNPPLNAGGCPAITYKLYRDDGEGTDSVDIQVDPVAFDQRELAFEYDVTLSSDFTGKSMNVKIEAHNAIGSTISKAKSFTLADKPGKPWPMASVVSGQTSTTQITVDFSNQNLDDGGAPLIFVQLWMDDGNQGEFSLVF